MIRSLRQRVASRLEDCYWQGEEVCGLEVRQVVHESHKGIKDYVHDLKNQQWASPEISLALDILQVSACVCTPGDRHWIGEESVKNYIVLKGKHWVIAKNVKKATAFYGPIVRGGMEKWTWEERQRNGGIPDDLPEWAIPLGADTAQPTSQDRAEVQPSVSSQSQESSSSSGGGPIVQKSSPSQHSMDVPNLTLHDSVHESNPQPRARLVPPKIVPLRLSRPAQGEVLEVPPPGIDQDPASSKSSPSQQSMGLPLQGAVHVLRTSPSIQETPSSSATQPMEEKSVCPTTGLFIPDFVKGVAVPTHMMDYEDDKETVVVEEQTVEAKEVSLEKSLVFEHESASLSNEHDLPPAWAWSGTQSEKIKANLVNVIFGQSIKSDLAQITFKKVGVMSVGAIKARLTDILLMRKERLTIFPAWDQTKVLEECRWRLITLRLKMRLLCSPPPMTTSM